MKVMRYPKSPTVSTGSRPRLADARVPWRRTLSVAMGGLVLATLAAACHSTASTPTPNAGKLFQLGLKAQGAGQSAVARADYDKALAQDPTNHYKDNKYVYFNLGVLDQSGGDNAGAATEYRRALLVDPNYLSALYNLAIVDTPTAPESAILLYQQILAITPKDPNTLYNLGLLLYSTGQVAQGQTMLREAISLAPSLASKLPSTVKL
jgi:tetratricopeptide (TPR) repeat protein